MALEAGIIADDLTGALDVAAPFAERGLRTLVVLSPDALAAGPDVLRTAEVICVNTASREITREDAWRRVTAAATQLMALEPAIVFKKIDSRLKGHIAVETDAMLAATGRACVIAAPAIPDMGRLVVGGAVTGMGVAEPIDVLKRFHGLPVAVPDTSDGAAMDRIADEVAADRATTLAVGARGLAQALARRYRARPSPRFSGQLPQPALVAIGSRDPITRAQTDMLMRDAAPRRIEAPDGHVPSFHIGGGLTLVTIEDGGAGENGALVASRFAEGIAGAVRRAPPAAMLICGGETAQTVLTRLGVEILDLGGEALPGIPFASALIEGQQVVILTKSGGFGAPDTISLLASEPLELN
jgi:uncharacterized protein YgbK (DUF1537 family)